MNEQELMNALNQMMVNKRIETELRMLHRQKAVIMAGDFLWNEITRLSVESDNIAESIIDMVAKDE
jgi:hypothetical protein